MAKGFVVPKDLRKERDAVLMGANSRPDLEKGETNEAFAWVVANKPGAVPVGGGRKQRYARWHRNGAAISLQQAKKRNSRIKRLARYTPPREK